MLASTLVRQSASEATLSLILGIAEKPHPKGCWCTTNAADPALERFIAAAWESAIELGDAMACVTPGLYPLTLHVVYEVVGSEVVRLSFEIVEGARTSKVDAAFADAVGRTGRWVESPIAFADGVRTVQTTVLLEVPESQLALPTAPPELTASFAEVARGVLAGLRRGAPMAPGDHVIDLKVAPVGDRWRVEPLVGPPSSMVCSLVAALRQAGLLAEDGEAGSAARVSLLVRTRPVG